MKKEDVLKQIIKHKEPSVSELKTKNHSLYRKNKFAYAGLIGLSALSLLMGGYAYKKSSELTKRNQENEDLRENLIYYKANNVYLSQKLINLSDYAADAEKLASSITFYPDMPDSVSALNEEEQEKAEANFEKQNQEAQDKHDEALNILGVDRDLLFRIKQGPKLHD